ncbi:tRNA1(Val) (adenine(37)-N6)-methyltransferase [Paenibacillus campi]|uniref:tRNA1(Val) (adenine(37)-N6)-methyltransferase n=1 Tax=Paenibacillus campi TaxID=3106031 RepID=UPI002AFDF99D|nr:MULTISPECIES: tRNA1(Val) (adenine(37)-N6)-methyltransferase [unclassified Paenibacillus]
MEQQPIKETWLQEGERLDDLLTHQLHIIQSREVFSFSMDAVLLARFAAVPPRGRIIDLCTGNGVIPLLLSTRTKAAIEGVEIQERLAHMAQRSVEINQLQQQITIRLHDLKELPLEGEHGVYELVTVNPPYMPMNGNDMKLNHHQAMARHEIGCTLEDVIRTAASLLKNGGKLAMVHRPQRLVDIVTLMRSLGVEPKRIRFVHPRQHMEANMILVEGIRGGKPDLRILPPLIVYNEHNEYVPEIMDIYYGQKESL